VLTVSLIQQVLEGVESSRSYFLRFLEVCDLLDGPEAPPLVGQVKGHEDKELELSLSFATGSRRSNKFLEVCDLLDSLLDTKTRL